MMMWSFYMKRSDRLSRMRVDRWNGGKGSSGRSSTQRSLIQIGCTSPQTHFLSYNPQTTRSFIIFFVRHQLDQWRGRDTRFPASLLKNLHPAGSFVRRYFARVLLRMNLVGKESPRCLTLSADRARCFRSSKQLSPWGT